MLNIPATKMQTKPQKTQTKKDTKQGIDKTLEAVLINSHVKNAQERMTIDEFCDTLMLTSEENNKTEQKNETQSFNLKKALMPLAIGTGAVFLGAAVISGIVKKSSNAIVKKYCEELPLIAHNMNIPEETHLSIYEVLRNPSPRNILAASAVFLFSGLTITAKNFVDGAKEIWLKKREADIERDLQENLISVEASVFSGKLQTVNKLMKESAGRFKEVFNEQSAEEKAQSVFKNKFSFRGQVENNNNNKEQQKDKKKNAMFFLASAGIVLACAALGKYTFSNIKKTNTQMEKYAKDMVDEGLKKGKIFSDASNGLSGDAGLISFYSYLNEPRGHLYNWVLNPENKFLRNIFTSFSAVSAFGYLFKEGMDAAKTTTVQRENARTELDLKKRLVNVEINNFKAKKDSAIKPLINDFNKKLESGEKSKEELRDFAENILFEIKNGPPYVYS